MDLSIVIPAYNEVRRLPSTLDQILSYVASRPAEVIVVDDGSVDGTAELVERSYSQVRLLRNPGNCGKGYSVRNGMLQARGEWILFSDADLSTPIEELDKLFEAARKEPAEVLIGSRAIDRSLILVRQPWMRETLGRMFNFFMRTVTGLKFQDTQCGFKLYSAVAAKKIFSRQLLDGFSFDVEDLYIAKLLHIPVVEVPVKWSNAEGTKVSLTQGLKSFTDLLRILYFNSAGKYR